MRKLIAFNHVSLDGFVCGPNGEMNWIKINDEIFSHVEQRIKQTDTALYGRVTYELMESYWPTAADKPNATRHDLEHSKWYAHAHKLVMSRTLAGDTLANTTIINDNLTETVNEIKNKGGEKDVLVFGSPRATHALIQQGLIDGYWMFVNPVILGKGIPLFTGIPNKINLELLNTKQFACGVTELNYSVIK